MSKPMQRFVTSDGRTFLIPGDAQRVPDKVEEDPREKPGFYFCECHTNMGNDFYFLPMGSCLRRDRKCTHTEG